MGQNGTTMANAHEAGLDHVIPGYHAQAVTVVLQSFANPAESSSNTRTMRSFEKELKITAAPSGDHTTLLGKNSIEKMNGLLTNIFLVRRIGCLHG